MVRVRQEDDFKVEVIEHFPHRRRRHKRPWVANPHARVRVSVPEAATFEVRRRDGQRDGAAEFGILALVQRELQREPRAGVTEIAANTGLDPKLVKPALEYLLAQARPPTRGA